MLDVNCLNNLVYIGASFSLISRSFYAIVIYKNKSTNIFSLCVCGTTIISSTFWLYYAIEKDTIPLYIRSIFDIVVSIIAFVYIYYNRKKEINKKPSLYVDV